MPHRLIGLAVLVACLAICPAGGAHAQRPIAIAPNAPDDKPASVTEQCQWDALVRVLDPYVAQARTTYPAAKRRFLVGLPPRQTFFVTVRLTDSLAHHEQVFVAVDSIVGDSVVGRLASEIELVRGYRAGQRYVARESDVLDWLISRPDGGEDGNVVGKFLDTYQPPRSCTNREQTRYER